MEGAGEVSAHQIPGGGMPGAGRGTCPEDRRLLQQGYKQREWYATICILEIPLWSQVEDGLARMVPIQRDQ